MQIISSRPAAVLVSACAALALAGAVKALDDLRLEIAAVSGAGWSAQDIGLRLQLPQQHAQASIGRLRIGPQSQTLHEVRIDCPRLELSATEVVCRQARVALRWPATVAQALTADVRYGRRDGSLDLAIHGVRLGGGVAEVRTSLRPQGWTVQARLQHVALAQIRKIAAGLALPYAAWPVAGFVTASASARGRGSRIQQAQVEATLAELTLNNAAGSIASDKLGLRAQIGLQRAAAGWQFSLGLDARSGQAYLQPFFFDFGAYPLSATAQGSLQGTQQLTLQRFTLDHRGVAQASGSASLDMAQARPLRAMQLQLATLQFPGAYGNYLQPLLLDTSLKSARTDGSLSGKIVVAAGEPRSIELQLQALSVDAGARVFAVNAMGGHWHWHAAAYGGELAAAGTDDTPASSIQWRDGALFGLTVGAGNLQFLSSGRQFRLLEPTRIPLLDGALSLQSLQVRNAGLPSVAFIVDATLEPIDVARLCSAFGWPQFGGRIGGVISKLRMREGVVRLGTRLEAQVFGGGLTLSDLKLEQPFGQWPRLYASIALDNLDLELVTRAFSFGRITGRLSGAIDGLRLFNWVPVAFDARFYTPAADRSRHRISQRAVQNLGSVGGSGAGVTAVLSSGLLRFFEDFNYDRLGLSCRLENEVCVMDGIAPTPQGGYYVVKGRGLPRIDVIGSARRVDWPRLVQQLSAATRSQGPVVD